ncbi:CIC11C00000001404 [Sungouiella intermedia]|uniref:CIC11C00000001404 n=1 Tax=Sungouiella intermedia TaxID=45354 RepID=A0A1L0DGB5_9ASCO|nr:CIC11C00000001404 [[Candida] intermedia]
MYQSYYPIGTAGHRATSLYNYHPHSAYYPIHPGASMAPPPPPPYVPAYSAPPAPAPPADEPVTGGINAVLEYEPQNMAAFLCWCAFGMLNQNRSPSKEFEKDVVSILYATRLPKSSIVIALEYLNQRFSNTYLGNLSELEMFVKIVVALVLANKFNDDNTFTNRSWCGATGLRIELLNSEEATWLKEVNWKLNVVNFQVNIKTLEECWRTWMSKYSTLPAMPAVSASYCSPALSNDSFHNYSSIPSSPVYESSGSSMYNTSPESSSPIKFSLDWPVNSMPLSQPHFHARPNPYVPVQPQSIWSYTPSQYQYVPPVNELGYYGCANPYYCSMASC